MKSKEQRTTNSVLRPIAMTFLFALIFVTLIGCRFIYEYGKNQPPIESKTYVFENVNDRMVPKKVLESKTENSPGEKSDETNLIPRLIRNFKVKGVLYDTKYRYTYYSSNVLFHYRTLEWDLGCDGIYRDSEGRVIVASDDYELGTVLDSDIFGQCIVCDTGVGTSGTLDVYTAF